MGLSMARNLQRAGYRLTVFTRTRSRAQPLIDSGAEWASSPEEAARQALALLY